MVFVVYGLMALLTIGYCWFIWLAVGAYATSLPKEFFAVFPPISKILAYDHARPFPYHVLPWQILAVASLAINFLWGKRRSQRLNSPEGHGIPVACHIGWILLCLCWHGVGMLLPIVVITPVIK
jgi:hypothetical protein